MGNAKHTPGPWCPVLYGYFYTLQIDDCYGSVDLLREQMEDDDGPSGVESAKMHANATLAAAAPELLTACKSSQEFLKYALEFFDWSKWPNVHDGVVKLKALLDAAIAKAEGGAN